MKIYTKTGDRGETGLYSGTRVAKYHPRVETYGTIDELNACIGLLRDHVTDQAVRAELLTQQQHLFALGAALADDRPGQAYQLPPDASSALENAMDAMDAHLPRMTHFILPGGAPVVSYAHLCRTVCRRAERRTVELAEAVELDSSLVIYLNRLSDYFFVLSRHLARLAGVEEIKWIS
ncbi:cob(I)yrinic acid a,c-diamide adenosyltransferase [Neolewinella lacunae]|uniref:Corrinoid adenosyltransferase n=1 Tax=Neolewinella lacunae TaxID=1517758 RepID=A0A923PRN2_9BACT|nr:cob(I)yrinic acid a,c-diamide adenosyltransferase [Neolewinella lacunae]MBC6996511.1 cob(I)yrinic acid a,c-diamide adenosyltransferase [Neolewinella lacunae]MDN3636664.1 cob(I)yrinic acid a,c-diamide adenosyltransferase [Neolewinella lacunae]